MPDSTSLSRDEQLALVRSAQLRGWLGGEKPLVESLLANQPGLAGDAFAVVELVHAEAVLRQGRGERPEAEEYARRFAGQAEAIRARFGLDPHLRPALPSPATVTPPPDESATLPPPDAPADGGEADWPEVPGYEIVAELGRGGMGVVYKARQVKLNRVVALKVVLAGSHAGAAEMKRFRTEAEAIARLQHPNIVQVFEVGEHAAGSGKSCPYFSLEYCDGGSLADRLGQPLDFAESAALIETLARAVEAAHQHGVVHRDLKPGNVLLATSVRARSVSDGSAAPPVAYAPGSDLTPKITDFGLAKLTAAAGGAAANEPTRTGAIMGTPGYMAPEQAAGRSKEVGPAADVWALGAILYECLTGRPPFRGADMIDTLLQVMEHEPTPPRQLNPKAPSDLETICLKCLQKEPTHRYVSAAALADDLRRFRADEPIKARPPSLARRVDRWVRKHQALVVAYGTTLMALAGLAWFFDVGALLLTEGLRGVTGWEALWLVLPATIVVVAAMARGHAGVSLLALLLTAPAAWGLWWWTGYGRFDSIDPFRPELYWAGLACLAALVPGVWRARGWRETLVWLVVVGAVVPLAGMERFPLFAAHGVVVGLFVWLVRWALGREAGTIALGGLIGAFAGILIGEGNGLRLASKLMTQGHLLRMNPSQAAFYLEACVTFAGALAGGLLGPRSGPQRLRGGDHVVPSQNKTSSS